MKLNRWLYVAGLGVLALGGCTVTETESRSTGTGGDPSLVAFAQANSQDPWRQVFDAEIKAAAEQHKDLIQFEMQDASDDPTKQIDYIDTVLVKKPSVLLVSPVDESLEQAVAKAEDAGVPVILLDRAVPGDKYTCWVGGDNREIGRQAAEFIGEQLGGKGTVLMVKGIANATATIERGEGAMEVFKAKYPGITVIEGDDCKYQRQAATSYMETFLQKKTPFDAVYAHNDEMAIGAYLAMERAGVTGKTIVGVDACQQEVVDYIKDGKISATFKYPQPGARAIEVAAEIVKGNKPTDKKIVLETTRVTKENADQYLKDNPNLFK